MLRRFQCRRRRRRRRRRCSLRCRRRGWFVTNTMMLRCRGRLIGVAVAVVRLLIFVVVVDCVVVVAESAALFVVGSAVNWRNDFVVGVCAALRNNSLLSLSELPWTDARVSSWLLPPQSWLVTPSLCFFVIGAFFVPPITFQNWLAVRCWLVLRSHTPLNRT